MPASRNYRGGLEYDTFWAIIMVANSPYNGLSWIDLSLNGLGPSLMHINVEGHGSGLTTYGQHDKNVEVKLANGVLTIRKRKSA
jgi:hypothetical protein